MFIGIVGSRDFPDLRYVEDYVRNHTDIDDVIVSGGARGVDRTAERSALDLRLPVISFRPYNTGDGSSPWAVERVIIDPLDTEPSRMLLPGRYPSFAATAFVRNGYIVETSKRLAVFWDGQSRGTKDTLRRAQGANLAIDLFRVTEYVP